MSCMANSFPSFTSLLRCPFLNDIYLTTTFLIATFFPNPSVFITPHNALLFLIVLIPFHEYYTIYLFLLFLFPVYSNH